MEKRRMKQNNFLLDQMKQKQNKQKKRAVGFYFDFILIFLRKPHAGTDP